MEPAPLSWLIVLASLAASLLAHFLGAKTIASVPDEKEYEQIITLIRDLALFVAMIMIAGSIGFLLVVIAFIVLGFEQLHKAIPLFGLLVIFLTTNPVALALIVLVAYLQGILANIPRLPHTGK